MSYIYMSNRYMSNNHLLLYNSMIRRWTTRHLYMSYIYNLNHCMSNIRLSPYNILPPSLILLQLNMSYIYMLKDYMLNIHLLTDMLHNYMMHRTKYIRLSMDMPYMIRFLLCSRSHTLYNYINHRMPYISTSLYNILLQLPTSRQLNMSYTYNLNHMSNSR